MSRPLSELYDSSPLFGANAPYVEALYEQFLGDPQSVAQVWRDYFSRVRADSGTEVAHGPVKEGILSRAAAPHAPAARAADGESSRKQGAVSRLVQVYANRGHLIADIDPLGMMRRPMPQVLELGYFGLSEADLDTVFYTGGRVEAANDLQGQWVRTLRPGQEVTVELRDREGRLEVLELSEDQRRAARRD